MRFTTIRSNVNTRISNSRSFFESIKKQETSLDPILKQNARMSKGLFFVELYGIWEYTVHTTLQIVNHNLTIASIDHQDIKEEVLSIKMNSNFDSLKNSSKRKWEKRADVLKLTNDTQPFKLINYIDITSGKNIKLSQLETIWKCYSISTPIIPHIRFRGRLEELVDNRNEIAHGRSSAYVVGRRYTLTEIEQRLNDLDTMCFHYISKLEDYIKNLEYIR